MWKCGSEMDVDVTYTNFRILVEIAQTFSHFSPSNQRGKLRQLYWKDEQKLRVAHLLLPLVVNVLLLIFASYA